MLIHSAVLDRLKKSLTSSPTWSLAISYGRGSAQLSKFTGNQKAHSWGVKLRFWLLSSLLENSISSTFSDLLGHLQSFILQSFNPSIQGLARVWIHLWSNLEISQVFTFWGQGPYSTPPHLLPCLSSTSTSATTSHLGVWGKWTNPVSWLDSPDNRN